MLITERTRDGIVITREDTGEKVGSITLNYRGDGYWLNMAEGYSFDAMPMRSLKAAEYLALASVLEFDAQRALQGEGE